MGGRYPHIMRAVLGVPWAIDPDSLAWAAILDVLAMRAAGERLSEEEISARIEAAANGPRSGGGSQGGVALIPVYGVISPRANMLGRASGGTTAEELGTAIAAAAADDAVKAIVLDIDSPGGNVEGIEELAAQIRSVREQKPVVAVANHVAASAAYWIAASASEVVVTPSGKVGSIGIIAAHDNLAKALEMKGIERTVISAGKHKADGQLDMPISAAGVEHLQAQADTYYSMFLGSIAKGRSVSADTVRSDYGEGRVVLAKAALAAGMVDRIEALDATIRRVSAAPGRIHAPGTAAAVDDRAERLAHVAMRASLPEITVHEIVGGLIAGPMRGHKTATSDDAWDGPANESRCPGDESHLAAAHAWRDDAGDPDAKSSYKFIHHEISADGAVGAANVNACANGRAVLRGGRGGTTIPDGDKSGVWNHLAGHERDAGREVEDYALESSPTPITAADRVVPGRRVQRAMHQAALERGYVGTGR